MTYISHDDVQALLEAIKTLYSDLSVATLPQRTMQAVEKIIQADIVAFDGFGGDDKYTDTAWASRQHLYTPEKLEIFREFIHQHPLIPVVIGNKIQSAIKMTDYISQPEFENLELYNEYFRDIGVRQQMGLALPVTSDFTFSCSVNRWENDFTERDRLLLTLIAPHLSNAISNTNSYERLNRAVEEKSTGVIAIDSEGKTQFVSELAQKFLATYFAGEKLKKDSLPLGLQNWIESQSAANTDKFDLPAFPLKIANSGGELSIRLIRNSITLEKTLLLEETRFVSPKSLESLNLTRRESEILFWIARGKTDKEIGEVLSISPRTVHKHSERIYNKLGVETRTAAVLRALEFL